MTARVGLMSGKVYIRTFGCQMNVKDTERMMGLLAERGYAPCDDPGEADVLLVNTCSVREKPEQKVFGALGRLKSAKDANPRAVIGVCGCVAQRMGQELLDAVNHLDLVVGTQAIHRLPELVERAREGERIAAVDWLEVGDQDLFATPREPAGGISAFVSIMQGCDNHCAYCIVPSVRGPQVSRKMDAVIGETSALAEKGVREITLLGQNVNAYVDGSTRFPDILDMVSRVDGVARVRFTTSHPKDLDDRLIEVMAENDRIMENFHLPVQAGSDAVLARMNRGYDSARYLGLIRKLREAMPDIGITTDLIVGFPGETQMDFQATLDLVSEVRYDETFSFRYSIRPGTQAALFDGQVPEDEKYDRLYRLQELQRRITENKNLEQVGKTHEVLVTGTSKTDPTRMSGRSRTNRLVHFSRNGHKPGDLVKLKITRALKHSLAAQEDGPR